MASEDPYEEQDTDNEQQPLVEAESSGQPRAHPLLAVLCFLVAVILLLNFFSSSLDGLLRILILGGGIVSGMLGVILLEKRITLADTGHASEQVPILTASGQLADESEQVPILTTSGQLADEGEQVPALTAFEQLVQEALASIPAEFQEQMENLVVLVEDEPDASLLEELHEGDEAKEGWLLLGLYQGVPLTRQSYRQMRLPERITIYQSNIERYCHGDPERIREQVRSTVLHEVAHHFGMDHDAMPIWIK